MEELSFESTKEWGTKESGFRIRISTEEKVTSYKGRKETLQYTRTKEKMEKYSRILSEEVDEAIGEITENNSISSTQLQNKTQQEFSSTQLSDDDFQQNQN